MRQTMRDVHLSGAHDTAPRPNCSDCKERWPRLMAALRADAVRREYSGEATDGVTGFFAKRVQGGEEFLGALAAPDIAEDAYIKFIIREHGAACYLDGAAGASAISRATRESERRLRDAMTTPKEG